MLELFLKYAFVFATQSYEVFGIAGIGCVVGFGAELLVVVDEVGYVKW